MDEELLEDGLDDADDPLKLGDDEDEDDDDLDRPEKDLD